MTIAPERTSALGLTDNDYIVTRNDEQPDMVRYALPWNLGVSFHIRPETPVLVRIYESERRVVVRLGAFSADLDIFVHADQLDRLITVLTAGRERLR